MNDTDPTPEEEAAMEAAFQQQMAVDLDARIERLGELILEQTTAHARLIEIAENEPNRTVAAFLTETAQDLSVSINSNRRFRVDQIALRDRRS